MGVGEGVVVSYVREIQMVLRFLFTEHLILHSFVLGGKVFCFDARLYRMFSPSCVVNWDTVRSSDGLLLAGGTSGAVL